MVAIAQWFLSNGMLLNANKSDSVVVSTSAQANKIPANAVIMVAGHAIKPAISFRSLGVMINDRLSFNNMSQKSVDHVTITLIRRKLN